MTFPGLSTTDVDASSGSPGQDYTGLENYPVLFAAGQLSTLETIDIRQDEKKEGLEYFVVTLHAISSTPDNLDFCSKDVNVFIKDDDGKYPRFHVCKTKHVVCYLSLLFLYLDGRSAG